MVASVEERLMALEKENVEFRRDLSTLKGQFEYISGQLRDLQLYTHARFEQIDRRFEQIDRRFEQVDRRFDEMPGIVRDVMREVLAESRKSN